MGNNKPNELETYYSYLKNNGADVAPTFDSFKKTLSDENSAKQYYQYLKDNKFDAPETYDSFANTLGLKKKGISQLPSNGGVVPTPFTSGIAKNEVNIPFVYKTPLKEPKTTSFDEIIANAHKFVYENRNPKTEEELQKEKLDAKKKMMYPESSNVSTGKKILKDDYKLPTDKEWEDFSKSNQGKSQIEASQDYTKSSLGIEDIQKNIRESQYKYDLLVKEAEPIYSDAMNLYNAPLNNKEKAIKDVRLQLEEASKGVIAENGVKQYDAVKITELTRKYEDLTMSKGFRDYFQDALKDKKYDHLNNDKKRELLEIATQKYVKNLFGKHFNEFKQQELLINPDENRANKIAKDKSIEAMAREYKVNSSLGFILAETVDNSIIGNISKLLTNNIDLSDTYGYEPNTVEGIAAGVSSLLVDMPFFEIGGAIGKGAVGLTKFGKAGEEIVATNAILTEKLIEKGLSKSVAKKVAEKVTEASLEKAKSYGASIGSFALYDGMNKAISQVNEGNWDDASFMQMTRNIGGILTKGAEGGSLGLVLNGFGQWNKYLSNQVDRHISNKIVNISTKGALGAVNIPIEAGIFTGVTTFYEGKSPTSEDFKANLGFILGLKAQGLVKNIFTPSKWIPKLSPFAENIYKTEDNRGNKIENPLSEQSVLALSDFYGYKGVEKQTTLIRGIIENPQDLVDFVSSSNVPLLAKAEVVKIATGSEPISLDLRAVKYTYDEKTDIIKQYNNDGELVSRNILGDANMANIEMNHRGNKLQNDFESFNKPTQSKINALILSKINNLSGLSDAKKIPFSERTEEQNKLVDDYFLISEKIIKEEKDKREIAKQKAINDKIEGQSSSKKIEVILSEKSEGDTFVVPIGNKLSETLEIKIPEKISEPTKNEEKLPLDELIGKNVTYNGIDGILEKNKDGFLLKDEDGNKFIIESGESGKSAKELSVEVDVPLTKDQIDLALKDSEHIGIVDYKGKKYFVATANPKKDNTIGDKVFRVDKNGNIISEALKSNSSGKEKKLAIINTLLESKGLPKRESLVIPKEIKNAGLPEVNKTEAVGNNAEVQRELIKPKIEIVDELPLDDKNSISVTIPDNKLDNENNNSKDVKSTKKVVEPQIVLNEKSVEFKWLGDTEVGTEISRENGKVKIKDADGVVYNIKESDVVSISNKINEAIKDLHEIPKEKEVADKYKSLADEIRKAKLGNNISMLAVIPYQKQIINGAIEVLAKTVERTGDLMKGIDKAVKYIQNSDWYKSMNDKQRKQEIEEFTSQFGQYKEKSNTLKQNIAQASGLQKSRDVVVDEMKAFQYQLKAENRGAKNTKKLITDMLKEYKDELKNLNISPRSIRMVIAKINGDGTEAIKYLENIIADKDYSIQLKLANKNIADLRYSIYGSQSKKGVRSTLGADANQQAKEIGSIVPELLTIEQLKEFNSKILPILKGRSENIQSLIDLKNEILTPENLDILKQLKENTFYNYSEKVENFHDTFLEFSNGDTENVSAKKLQDLYATDKSDALKYTQRRAGLLAKSIITKANEIGLEYNSKTGELGNTIDGIFKASTKPKNVSMSEKIAELYEIRNNKDTAIKYMQDNGLKITSKEVDAIIEKQYNDKLKVTKDNTDKAISTSKFNNKIHKDIFNDIILLSKKNLKNIPVEMMDKVNDVILESKTGNLTKKGHDLLVELKSIDIIQHSQPTVNKIISMVNSGKGKLSTKVTDALNSFRSKLTLEKDDLVNRMGTRPSGRKIDEYLGLHEKNKVGFFEYIDRQKNVSEKKANDFINKNIERLVNAQKQSKLTSIKNVIKDRKSGQRILTQNKVNEKGYNIVGLVITQLEHNANLSNPTWKHKSTHNKMIEDGLADATTKSTYERNDILSDANIHRFDFTKDFGLKGIRSDVKNEKSSTAFLIKKASYKELFKRNGNKGLGGMSEVEIMKLLTPAETQLLLEYRKAMKDIEAESLALGDSNGVSFDTSPNYLPRKTINVSGNEKNKGNEANYSDNLITLEKLKEQNTNKYYDELGSIYKRTEYLNDKDINTNIMEVFSEYVTDLGNSLYLNPTIKSTTTALNELASQKQVKENGISDLFLAAKTDYVEKMKQKFVEDGVNYFIKRLGQGAIKALLGSVKRIPQELPSNIARNFEAIVKGESKGVYKNRKEWEDFANDFNSDVFNKKMVSKWDGAKNEVNNLWVTEAINQLAEYPIQFSDGFVRPEAWKSTVSMLFKDLSGKEFDIKKYSTDAKYRELNKEDLETTVSIADGEMQQTYAPYNLSSMAYKTKIAPFVSPNKNNTTFGYFNTWITSFPRIQAYAFIDATRNLAFGDKYQKINAVKELSGIYAQNMIYTAVSVTLTNIIGKYTSQLFGDERSEAYFDKNLADEATFEYWLKMAGANFAQLGIGKYGNVFKYGLGVALGAMVHLSIGDGKKKEQRKSALEQYNEMKKSSMEMYGLNIMNFDKLINISSKTPIESTFDEIVNPFPVIGVAYKNMGKPLFNSIALTSKSIRNSIYPEKSDIGREYSDEQKRLEQEAVLMSSVSAIFGFMPYAKLPIDNNLIKIMSKKAEQSKKEFEQSKKSSKGSTKKTDEQKQMDKEFKNSETSNSEFNSNFN